MKKKIRIACNLGIKILIYVFQNCVYICVHMFQNWHHTKRTTLCSAYSIFHSCQDLLSVSISTSQIFNICDIVVLPDIFPNGSLLGTLSLSSLTALGQGLLQRSALDESEIL